jgi:hypothetical protein
VLPSVPIKKSAGGISKPVYRRASKPKVISIPEPCPNRVITLVSSIFDQDHLRSAHKELTPGNEAINEAAARLAGKDNPVRRRSYLNDARRRRPTRRSSPSKNPKTQEFLGAYTARR